MTFIAIFFLHIAVKMASLLESTASFRTRAVGNGLTEAQITYLVNNGINSLSKLAFAATTPGVTPSEDALRQLLDDEPARVTLGALSAIRRLMFEAQTLSVALVKQTVEGTDGSVKAELAPAERAQRIADQKTRLGGISFQGPYECGHACYDVVADMLEKDLPVYPQPHRFVTRNSEVAKGNPPKELIIDGTSHIAVKDGKRQDKCLIRNELELSQALTRRSLAFDLMSCATFAVCERYQFLLGYLQMSPPPGYSGVTMEQILRADRAAWLRISEKLTTLRRSAGGDLPLDQALKDVEGDPAGLYHLLPCPGTHGDKKNTDKEDNPKKRKYNDDDKGKGKGKGKSSKVPAEIKDLNNNMPDGSRICWDYNLKNRGCKFAKPGAKCKKRGSDSCMKCFKDHPQFQCSDK